MEGRKCSILFDPNFGGQTHALALLPAYFPPITPLHGIDPHVFALRSASGAAACAQARHGVGEPPDAGAHIVQGNHMSAGRLRGGTRQVGVISPDWNVHFAG